MFHNDKRATALGLLEVYNGVGKVIAPIIGATVGLVIWSAVFIVYPLVALMAFLGISRYVENVKGSENVLGIRAYFQQAFRIVYQRKKELFPLFFIGGVGLFIVFGVLYFLSFLIQETYHIDGFFKGTAFFFPLSAMTLASYWSGKRIKNDEALMKKLMLLGTSLLFVTFGLLIFVHSLSVLMFSLTLAFGGLGFVLPCVNMMITSTASDAERGFVVSLYGTTRFLGVALEYHCIWNLDDE
ncbi:MFS transporter [Priestia flexa]|nr:MFS transporter [Priestia flexa]